MKDFKGVYAALPTPYDSLGNVNYAELKKYVRWLIDQGIDGFYVCGSTGEAFLLTSDERKAILEAVCEANNGEKKVIAHIAQIATEQALDLGRHAKVAGADAISAIAPFYYQFTLEEVKQYYFNLMTGVQIPFFVYNFPGYSGFTLTPELLDELSICPYLAGVKFTDADCYAMGRMKSAHPDLSFLYGNDQMLLSGLVAGADGAIGSTYNVLYAAAHGVYDSFQEKDMETAMKHQCIMNDMIVAITKFGLFSSIKEILGYHNIVFGDCRKPFLPVSEEGREVLKREYEMYCRKVESANA